MSGDLGCKQPDRQLYFDHLRVLATAAVILLHVSASNWFVSDVNGSDWATFNFYDSLAHFGVPIFVMISGALFLNRDDIPVKKIFSKYVLRLLIAYFAWSFIYFLFSGDSVLQQITGLFQPGGAGKLISVINVPYHFWFIPMIAGIYICLPIIKQIVKNQKASIYFLAISFVFWFLVPQIVTLIRDFGSESLIALTNAAYEKLTGLQLNLIMNYVFYFILGYELSRIKFSKKTRMIIYLLGIVGLAFTVIIEQIIVIKYQAPVETYYEYTCVNILVVALAVFELYKNIPFKNGKIGKIATRLSKWSFGAYLVHALVLWQFEKYGFDTLSFLPAISVPVITLAVFVCSFAISAIIHCIPILKKYIV